MTDKKDIRNYIKNMRKSLDEDNIAAKSRNIFERLLTRDEYNFSDRIFIYAGCKGEVLTEEIIKESLKAGKRVALPKVFGDKMDFFYINSLSELKKGCMGIPEPDSNEKAVPDEKTLFIMPGLAFDEMKNRVGYGGGYYDKYLAVFDDIKKIALAFDFQILDFVPSDIFDIRPNLIITETRYVE